MPKLLLLSLISFFSFCSKAQLKKYPISNSGCSVSMYCDPKKFNFDYSEDSSKVYTAECINSEINYGVICIKLLTSIDNLDKAEEMLTSYIDYLKLNFEIKTTVGYTKGNKLNKNEKTTGISDYWKDAEGNKWKIKAWTDGRFIGVLYAYSKKDLPEAKVNGFLDSFRLQE